jgi:hypothetical protein
MSLCRNPEKADHTSPNPEATIPIIFSVCKKAERQYSVGQIEVSQSLAMFPCSAAEGAPRF